LNPFAAIEPEKIINKDEIQERLKMAVSHELQHAVEQNYNLSQNLTEREKSKHQEWVEGYYQKENVPEEDRPYYNGGLDVVYINTPTEIRANLAEIFSQHNLPEDKEIIKEKMGSPSYEKIFDLVNKKDKFGRQKYISPQAKEYIVKELYKAIYN
jgi:hypothetical protein